CLAGVFTLADALALVAARGRLMQAMPGGVMLSVALPADELRGRLGPDVSIAADNAPRSCVASGREDAVAELEARLTADGVRHKRLHTSHAFHSPMMEPVAGELAALMARVARRAPELPWVSNVTGTWITPAEATDPAYWARHLREPVRFREGLATLAAVPGVVLLEVGPGQSLGALAEAQDGDLSAIASMRQPREETHDARFAMTALGRLWADGVDVDWAGVWKHDRRSRVLLPTYPFERTRHWLDAPPSAPAPAQTSGANASGGAATGSAEWLVAEQLRVMSRQLDLLRGLGSESAVSADEAPTVVPVSGPNAQASSVPATERIPLTPVQRWFFEQDPVDPHHFDHALAFDLAQPVDADSVRRALAAVVERHDALRNGYACDADGWHAFPLAVDAAFAVDAIDVGALPAEDAEAEMTRAAEVAQAGLALERGPIVRAMLIGRGSAAQRLVLVIHHLAVDVFSWSVILGDLEHALSQAARGDTVAIEAASTPFATWSRRLAAHARTDAARGEAPRWLALEGEDVRALPRDHRAGRNLEAGAATLDAALGEDDTRLLVEDAPRRLGSQVNDILLTALGRTLTAWAGGGVIVDLEGHGREDLFAEVELARTVGWFTAIHPFALRPDDDGPAERAVIAMRDRLRGIPRGGVGFGVLRHLGADAAIARRLRALPAAEAVFLYAGRHMAGGGDGMLRAAGDAHLGASRSPRAARPHLVEVTCFLDGDRLATHWRYSDAVHDTDTIARLADAFLAHVATLVRPAVADRAAMLVAAATGGAPWRPRGQEGR
ncbi:MAG TPA: condensation domain-containing protein, partial [Longimicrobiaceae bacterium]|nr:condensation domain-containing protein [Longimicrobiaceae bacterium]